MLRFLAGKLRGITTCAGLPAFRLCASQTFQVQAYIVSQCAAAILALLAVRQLFEVPRGRLALRSSCGVPALLHWRHVEVSPTIIPKARSMASECRSSTQLFGGGRQLDPSVLGGRPRGVSSK